MFVLCFREGLNKLLLSSRIKTSQETGFVVLSLSFHYYHIDIKRVIVLIIKVFINYSEPEYPRETR